MAQERGMSVLSLNEYAKMDTSVDREIDGFLASLAHSPASLIIDSRLAWYFLPEALKTYLVVDPNIAAERVFKADRTDENHTSIDIAYANNKERERLERERFVKLYSIDPQNWRNYDLIVDSTTASPDEVASIVLERIHQESDFYPRPECWLSPQRLIPTRPLSEFTGGFDEEGPNDCASLDVAVYNGAFLIVNGHASAAKALRLRQSLIRARLAAFETEQLFGGVSLETFARNSISLTAIRGWEEAHGFRLSTYPDWLGSRV
jgi:cytidylate kinase